MGYCIPTVMISEKEGIVFHSFPYLLDIGNGKFIIHIRRQQAGQRFGHYYAVGTSSTVSADIGDKEFGSLLQVVCTMSGSS